MSWRMELLLGLILLSVVPFEAKNVLLLLADDGGFEMGAYRNRIVQTPFLDALAKESLIFNNAYASVSSCSPSRASILTGMPEHQNGQYGLHNGVHNFNSLPKVRSISSILGKAGIRTGLIGKKHVGSDDTYKFNYERTEEQYPINQVGRNITQIKIFVREFLKQTKSANNDSFFLMVSFHDPHRCGHITPQYGSFCERWGSGEEGMGLIPDWHPIYYVWDEIDLPYYMPDTQPARYDLAAQYTTISRLDQGVGLVLKELRDAGMEDDTLVVYTSDNGPPMPAARTNLYDPGMAEPMFIRSPEKGVRRNEVTYSMTSHLDLVPTILEWFNLTHPQPNVLTGRSLLPLLFQEPSNQADDAVFASQSFHEITMTYPMRAIRTKRYKLIHNLNYQLPFPIDQDFYVSPTFQDILNRTITKQPVPWYKTLHTYYQRPEWEFYDLKMDPTESRNLFGKSSLKDTFRRLSERLQKWLEVTKDPFRCLPDGINTLQTLLKARRSAIIRKLIRTRKLFAAKSTANDSNLRFQKRAENCAAILDHIKALAPSILLEKVIYYHPAKNDLSVDSSSIENRSIARFMEDEALVRHLKSLENQCGLGNKSKLLDVLRKKRKIKASIKKQKKKEKSVKRLEHAKKKQQKTGSQKSVFDKKVKLKPKLSVSDDGYEVKRLKFNESDQSDEEEQFDQRSDLSFSVSEGDAETSSGEDSSEDTLKSPTIDGSTAKQTQAHTRANKADYKTFSGEDSGKDTIASPTINGSTVKQTQALTKENEQIFSEPVLPTEKKIVNYIAPEDEDEPDECEVLTDSFFITETGEQYVTIAPKLKPQAEGDEVKEEEESWKLINKRKKRAQQWEETYNDKELDTGLHNAKQSKIRKNFEGKGRFHSEKQTYGETSVPVNIKDDLHPSWAAKQAQKGIKPFAGKKIVFEEGHNNANFEAVTDNRFTSENSKQSDLHPSWAAKQAQQGIKPFAGKRVVFDAGDDDDGNQSIDTMQGSYNTKSVYPSSAAKQLANQEKRGIKIFTGKNTLFDVKDGEANAYDVSRLPPKRASKNNLHPSWEAKQAQRGIKPFGGKKIAFNDDDNNDESNRNEATLSKKIRPITKSNNDVHPSWAAKQAQKAILPFAGKKVFFSDENATTKRSRTTSGNSVHNSQADNSNLHPSWVAKQAQSGIKPFAGKKIAFNDDDNNDVSNRNEATLSKKIRPITKSNNDVHPSWAAKQAQKAILPFAGKKVFFSDDNGAMKRNRPTHSNGVHNSQADNSNLHPSWVAKQAQSGIKPFSGKKMIFDAE
uniref:Sulfatase N-terminal domain-containing protein n=1 Tax=Anopheles christyi TaxID=43041 RepID=A0A182KHP6_9DIPT